MYVDDIIALSPKVENINSLYNNLLKTINIKDLRPISKFLDIKISKDKANKIISLY